MTIDPQTTLCERDEFTNIVAKLSAYCRATGQIARTTAKGGSLIITKKVRRK